MTNRVSKLTCRGKIPKKRALLTPRHQAGRALFYSGRVEEALPYLNRAAGEMDYPQAQYVLGFLKDVGLQGVSVDTCGAGRLWRMPRALTRVWRKKSLVWLRRRKRQNRSNSVTPNRGIALRCRGRIE
jgi:hypothetical protein